MIYTSAVAYKFALFLYKNNHLSDFSIPKNEARNLYYQSFKKEVKNNHLNFGIVFHHTLSLLKKQPNHSLIIYKQTKLLNLQNREKDIDSRLNLKKVTSPVKVITHSLSFHNNNNIEKNDEIFVSRQECKFCDVKFGNSDKFEEHLSQEEHKFLAGLNKALLATRQQTDFSFTIDDSTALDNIILRKDIEKTLHLKIKNNTKNLKTITKIQTNEKIKDVVFTSPTCPYQFPSLTVIQFELKVLRKNEKVLNYPILFEFGGNNQQFAVELIFHTHNEFFDDLHPEEPYKRATKPVVRDLIEVVDSGERPDIFPQPKWKIPLPKYALPDSIAIVLNSGLKTFPGITRHQQQQLNYIKSLLPETKSNCYLTSENYTKLLDLLLFIEEHQMSKDIRDYDQEDQILVKDKNSNLLELQVPGLAEHRPSVIFADPVDIRETKQSTTIYRGFVHKVNESSVLLKFSHNFMKNIFVPKKKFYVHFSFNRYPLRVEHQAVQFVQKHNVPKVFFPERVQSRVLPFDKTVFNWFNRDISNNPEQQQAIRSITNKSAMPSPYLIFGPPGTGKTMTVVEAVKQIHKLTNEKVLICAPSNNAANEVTRRLITSIPTTDLHRYIAPSFLYHLIPESIKKYINYRNGAYYLPSVEEIVKFRIVVTTLTSAAKLVNLGCPPGHFSYVFIDEAGQATETETLVAIGGIFREITGQIVLAGDPRQLGPIIHSTLAKQYGFGTSMLERLMNTNIIYQKISGSYNSNALTKLVKNYRSHSVIINQPNELFYDKELETAGDNLINVAIGWEHLPNPKFPMVFHSVIGADQREKTSPSFFNVEEITVVVDYLGKLIGSRLQGMIIKEENIGIVTPYKKQAEKIRNACKKMKYNNDKLMVGTVEQFQGQERLIIIVSTVRSKSSMLKYDKKFHLGFLDNPKRFNVAITRAKALLIVIGNPVLLQLDENWKSLMDYCQKNNAITGDSFNFSQNRPEEAAITETELDEERPSFSRGIH